MKTVFYFVALLCLIELGSLLAEGDQVLLQQKMPSFTEYRDNLLKKNQENANSKGEGLYNDSFLKMVKSKISDESVPKTNHASSNTTGSGATIKKLNARKHPTNAHSLHQQANNANLQFQHTLYSQLLQQQYQPQASLKQFQVGNNNNKINALAATSSFLQPAQQQQSLMQAQSIGQNSIKPLSMQSPFMNQQQQQQHHHQQHVAVNPMMSKSGLMSGQASRRGNSVLREQRIKLLQDSSFLNEHGGLAQFIYANNAQYIQEQMIKQQNELLAQARNSRKQSNKKKQQQQQENEDYESLEEQPAKPQLRNNNKLRNKLPLFTDIPLNNFQFHPQLLSQQQPEAPAIGGVYAKKVMGIPTTVFKLKEKVDEDEENEPVETTTTKIMTITTKSSPVNRQQAKRPRPQHRPEQPNTDPTNDEEKRYSENPRPKARAGAGNRNKPQKIRQQQEVEEQQLEQENENDVEKIEQRARQELSDVYKRMHKVQSKQNEQELENENSDESKINPKFRNLQKMRTMDPEDLARRDEIVREFGSMRNYENFMKQKKQQELARQKQQQKQQQEEGAQRNLGEAVAESNGEEKIRTLFFRPKQKVTNEMNGDNNIKDTEYFRANNNALEEQPIEVAQFQEKQQSSVNVEPAKSAESNVEQNEIPLKENQDNEEQINEEKKQQDLIGEERVREERLRQQEEESALAEQQFEEEIENENQNEDLRADIRMNRRDYRAPLARYYHPKLLNIHKLI